MNIIAIFSSRNETLYFSQLLKSNGIFCQIVNTPKEAGRACGISVKFAYGALQVARNLLMTKPFRAFVGFFKYSQFQGRNLLEKI